MWWPKSKQLLRRHRLKVRWISLNYILLLDDLLMKKMYLHSMFQYIGIGSSCNCQIFSKMLPIQISYELIMVYCKWNLLSWYQPHLSSRDVFIFEGTAWSPLSNMRPQGWNLEVLDWTNWHGGRFAGQCWQQRFLLLLSYWKDWTRTAVGYDLPTDSTWQLVYAG